MACLPISSESIGSCDSSSTLLSLQHSEQPSIRVYVDHEGDMGKIPPPCGDDVMPLNHSRWHMLADKDNNPDNSDSLPLTRSNKSANQRNLMSHNRWASDVGEQPEEMETASQLAAETEGEGHTNSQHLMSPTRQVSGYRDSRTTETSATIVASVDATTISVPSVVAVQTLHPHCNISTFATDQAKKIRRRSFDMNPTLPQRQHSNNSLGESDDFSSSSFATFES
jgi:hypothetical protein